MSHTVVSAKDALAGILVGAMRADGREHAAEHKVLARIFEGGAPHARLRLVRLIEDLARQRERIGARRFLDECMGALPADQRPFALLRAFEVIIADARIVTEELEYFSRLNDLVRPPDEAPATYESGGLEA